MERQIRRFALPSTVVILVLSTILLLALSILRGRAAEANRIVELLDIRPGMRVADIGAGNGSWSERLAPRVGESGHVYVNEIDDGKLAKIRRRVKRSGLGNMSVVAGKVDSTELPEMCCDAILLRFVYHDLTHRGEMRKSLLRSLRPGGQVLIIEMRGFDHGIEPGELIAGMTSDGFRVVSRHPGWQGRENKYAVLFGHRSDSVPEEGSSMER